LEISFRTKQLERCFSDHKAAVRAFGTDVAKRYIQRIQIIKAARSLDELSRLPVLRFHALTGDRSGEYAINLTGFYRLIVTIVGSEVQVVQIKEVSKHYGD
jgi:proteic killer suppression protein